MCTNSRGNWQLRRTGGGHARMAGLPVLAVGQWATLSANESSGPRPGPLPSAARKGPGSHAGSVFDSDSTACCADSDTLTLTRSFRLVGNPRLLRRHHSQRSHGPSAGQPEFLDHRRGLSRARGQANATRARRQAAGQARAAARLQLGSQLRLPGHSAGPP